MVKPTVVDYSWARPLPSCLRSNGIVGVCRYLSWDQTGKNLTAAERTELHDSGLWILLNWEGSGSWTEFSGGAAAGRRAGARAKQLCNGLNAPMDVPVFVSADYGALTAHWSVIEQFLIGFGEASGRVVGFYGQGNLIDWLLDRGHVRWAWQTNAIGWGGVSSRAVLRQHIRTTICGASVDPNSLQGNPADWSWMPTQPTSPEDDMTPEEKELLRQTAASAKDSAEQAHSAHMYAAIATGWAAAGAITDIYHNRLGRNPDAKGLTVWSEQARDGASYEAIDAAIATSPEGKRYAESQKRK